MLGERGPTPGPPGRRPGCALLGPSDHRPVHGGCPPWGRTQAALPSLGLRRAGVWTPRLWLPWWTRESLCPVCPALACQGSEVQRGRQPSTFRSQVGSAPRARFRSRASAAPRQERVWSRGAWALLLRGVQGAICTQGGEEGERQGRPLDKSRPRPGSQCAEMAAFRSRVTSRVWCPPGQCHLPSATGSPGTCEAWGLCHHTHLLGTQVALTSQGFPGSGPRREGEQF